MVTLRYGVSLLSNDICVSIYAADLSDNKAQWVVSGVGKRAIIHSRTNAFIDLYCITIEAMNIWNKSVSIDLIDGRIYSTVAHRRAFRI